MLDKLGLAFLVSFKLQLEMSLFTALSSLNLIPIACRAPITNRRNLWDQQTFIDGQTAPTTESVPSLLLPSVLFFQTLSQQTTLFTSGFNNAKTKR
jgi:hypothetical protein